MVRFKTGLSRFINRLSLMSNLKVISLRSLNIKIVKTDEAITL